MAPLHKWVVAGFLAVTVTVTMLWLLGIQPLEDTIRFIVAAFVASLIVWGLLVARRTGIQYRSVTEDQSTQTNRPAFRRLRRAVWASWWILLLSVGVSVAAAAIASERDGPWAGVAIAISGMFLALFLLGIWAVLLTILKFKERSRLPGEAPEPGA